MYKASLLTSIAIGLFLLLSEAGISQSFSFYGGIRPNNLRASSHFSVKSDIIQKNKWSFAINYSFIKYTDSWTALTDSTNMLHLEYKREKSILDIPELERGIPIQFKEIDFKPHFLIHRLSLIAGYTIVDNSYFLFRAYAGLFVGTHRENLPDLEGATIDIIFNEGEETRVIFFRSYQIHRDILTGPIVRIDTEYKLFENLYIGLNTQAYLNFNGGADLAIGIGGTYIF